jgi:hypothetical protein
MISPEARHETNSHLAITSDFTREVSDSLAEARKSQTVLPLL